MTYATPSIGLARPVPSGEAEIIPQAFAASSLGVLLVAAARRHPARPALVVDNDAISYAEFLGRAAAIAGALRGARHAAVLAGRGLVAYTAIAGAALAGAAYVPLNPHHPRERLRFMLDASEAEAIVLDRAGLDVARALLEAAEQPLHVLLPEATTVPDWATTLPRHRFLVRTDLEAERHLPVPPEDSGRGAYLLFTSGSTGVPKGVRIIQSNVLAYLRHVAARYRPQAEDRFTQLFDLTFDLSVHDMFLCWGAGAALHAPPDSARINPRDFVRRHEPTFWFSVPSVAAFMARLHALRPGDFPSLRWALFCGEALPTRLALAFAEAAPNAIVENLYGPTEATIAITAFRLPVDPAERARLPAIVPIGTSFPGQSTRIVDGELCLHGSQVAEGYWRLPVLTTERFAPLPDRPAAERWYRTGDRASMTPDGLVLHGRLDRQIKLSGHRIELQDVEVALRRAAGSDSAAAIAWPIGADGLVHGLVGFVPDSAAPNETVLAACRALLPPYMRPAQIRRLAVWPVNANGKTDYAHLAHLMES